MFEVKSFELVTNEGKRNVKNCNAIRSQMFDKIVEVLNDAGFEAVKAANGEIAIATVVDSTVGDTYYTRLAVSLSNKALDSKTERKAQAKTEAPAVEVPTLFDAE